MTEEQIQQYLHKLQLTDLEPAADLETLKALQDAHLKFKQRSLFQQPGMGDAANLLI